MPLNNQDWEHLGYYWQSHNNPNELFPFKNIVDCPLGFNSSGVYWVGEQIKDSISCIDVYRKLITNTTTYEYRKTPVKINFLLFTIQDEDGIMNVDELKNYLNVVRVDDYNCSIQFNSTLIFDLYTKVDMLDNSLYNKFNIPLLDSKNGYKDMTSYHPLKHKNVSLFLTFTTENNISVQRYKCTVRGDWTPDHNYLRNYNYLTG